jgi:hypothetical protein
MTGKIRRRVAIFSISSGSVNIGVGAGLVRSDTPLIAVPIFAAAALSIATAVMAIRTPET